MHGFPALVDKPFCPISFDLIDSEQSNINNHLHNYTKEYSTNFSHQSKNTREDNQIKILEDLNKENPDEVFLSDSIGFESIDTNATDYFKEKLYRLKNISTGEILDLRDNENLDKVNNNYTCLSIEDDMRRSVAQRDSWKEFKKEIQKNSSKLWDVVESGNESELKKLLGERNNGFHTDVNFKGLDDLTVMHVSANDGNSSICKILLQNGAEINLKTRELKRTPLHLASMKGHLSVIELLLMNKALLNIQDIEGYTPLHFAVEKGHKEIVEFLLSKGANPTINNRYGQTPYELSPNAEIQQIFKNMGFNNEHDYCRVIIGNAILGNSRIDHVSKILYRTHRDKMMRLMEENLKKKLEEEKKTNFDNITVECFEKKNETGSALNKVGPHSFIIMCMLGRGSFGEVYLVEKIDNHQMYALKVLNKDKVMTNNLLKYTKTERNVLTILKHPFIVGLHYAFQTDNKLYLVLKYCPGGDLGSLMGREKRLPEAVAKIYLAEILLALEELHNNSIIFRDLKPDNVVIDEDGHALLTDFGLSKEGINLNISKSFCGSVAYLAPEMLQRSGHNRTVDYYLFGVLMYELLVGIPPFFSANRQQLFENILNAPLKLPKTLSEEAKSLLKHLLVRNPNSRLGATRGIEEIKNHKFFSDISWQDALNRKLKPPVPEKINFPRLFMNLPINDFKTNLDNDRNIPDWSFVGDLPKEEIKNQF